MEKPLMIKLRAASEEFGVSYDRLRKWCHEGVVANVRTGRDFLVNSKSLENYLNSAGLKDPERCHR